MVLTVCVVMGVDVVLRTSKRVERIFQIVFLRTSIKIQIAKTVLYTIVITVDFHKICLVNVTKKQNRHARRVNDNGIP